MTKNRHLILLFIGLLASGLLVACSSTTTAMGSATATAVPPTATSDNNATVQQATDTVSQFLQSLQDDPSGASSLDYLSEPLRADVASGNSLSTLLGIGNNFYRSFGVDTPQMDTNIGQVIVEAGLNYVSPVKRGFVLTDQTGSWLINTFISYSMPAMTLPEDRLAAAQVIIDYYQALQENQITDAMSLLAPSAAQNNEADVTTSAQEIQRITITSLHLLQASPDKEVYSAMFWVTPNSADPGKWTTGGNMRQIELTHTNDGWRIAQVTNESMATPVPTPPTNSAPDSVIQQTAQALAQTLGIDDTAVSVVQAKDMQWPDSCLGIQTPGIMCAQHVVAGYQVILEANGQQFTYRSNGDGSSIAADIALTWNREGGIAGFCNELVIDVTGTATAYSCEGMPYTQVGQLRLNPEPRQQLYDWLNTRQPFNVKQSDNAVSDAMTITLNFNGQGDTTASDTDQSNIAAFAAQFYAQMTPDQATPTPAATTSAACTLVANSNTILFNRPDANASQFGVLSAGEKAVMGGQTAAGWLGFDPAVAQAANVGIFRLRWVAPGSDVTASGSCDTLPMYPAISPTACYEMAMAETTIYDQPMETAVSIATLPAGSYTAVTGKNDQGWYQVNLGDGSLAKSHSGQTGWIAPDAGNFNGQSCANLPLATP